MEKYILLVPGTWYQARARPGQVRNRIIVALVALLPVPGSSNWSLFTIAVVLLYVALHY